MNRLDGIRGALLAVVVGLLAAAPAFAASDAWITTKAKMKLYTTEGVSGTAINVDTMDGTVTLHGKVRSADEKSKAEQVVRAIDGVKGVRNLLAVVTAAHEEAVETSDASLKDKVEKAIEKDSSLADSSIKVQSVNNGVVLLGGKASSLTDHLRALEVAAAVPGVRRVASEVQSPDTLSDAEIYRERAPGESGEQGGVSGAVSDMWITSATKLRLLADSRVPGLGVNVDTRGGEVTLFGIVPSPAAKTAAGDDAREVSGVKRVVNALEVVPSAAQESVKARDEDVRSQVEGAIDARTDLEKADIEVEVQNGVARLTGTVGSQEQRLAAAVVARQTAGVRSVRDELRIGR